MFRDPYACDDWFDFETGAGDLLLVRLTRYYPGTNFWIDSRSLEPNDEPEYEYEVYLPTTEESDTSEWVYNLNFGLKSQEKEKFNNLFLRVYDDDGVYEDQEVFEAVKQYVRETSDDY